MPRRRWIIVAGLAVIFGIGCRLAQFLSNQSFGGDEADLLLNVRAKTPAQLLGPLTMTVAGRAVAPQTAPPLYLLALKTLAARFGDCEFTYRLPALLMGALTLILMAMFAFSILDPPAAAIAVTLTALSERLIEAPSLVKQYSGDMAAAILLSLLAAAPAPARAAVRLGIVSLVAAVGVWFAEPIVFLFGGISLALLPQVLAQERRARGWFIWSVCCIPAAASIAILYFVSMRFEQDPHFYAFWVDYFPDFSRPLLLPWWFIKQVYLLFNYPYHPMGAIVLALALLGVARWRRQGKGQLAAVLILPMAVTLLASILHRYPFGGSRVDLFLVPAVLLLAAAGLSELAGRLPAPRRNWAWAAAAPLLISGASQATYHLFAPRCTSHLRPAVRFVQNHYQDGDTIVLAGSETPQIFYTYWPRPPCKVVILPDRQTVPLTGRFWCVCEFAPGEFAKKRKPTIDLESAGAAAIADESYLGRGGAAMLFVR